MDWQHVKDRVTEEVLKQMKAEGVGSAQAPVAAGITSEAPVAAAAAPVVTQAGRLPACEVGEDFRTDVLVVVTGPVSAEVATAIRHIAEGRQVTVVSSEPSERLAEMQACGQVVGEGTETVARRMVKGAETVVVPMITTSTAAKVGSLIGDEFASAVLVQAALAGKKVLVAREGMAAPDGATWSIRRKVEEVVSALRTLGFTVTDLNGVVAGATGKAAGAVPAYRTAATGRPAYGGNATYGQGAIHGQGGFVPAYKRQGAPHAAPVAATPAPAAAGDYDTSLARMIDHTLLKPEATAAQITKICEEARQYGFMSVCVNPGWVPLCSQLLAGTNVKVCTVIGFPLGATSTAAKAAETADSIAKGATEVDMVMNVGAMKSGQYDLVLEDMKAVAQAARGKALTKVILETGLLTDEEKVRACQMAKQAGLDFVKTSTGFGPGGATAEDIALMRKTVGPNMGVKASGGIRDYDKAMAMVRAGANRIGASASVNIVKKVKADPNAKGKY